MGAKAQMSRSDLPAKMDKKSRRKTSRAGFAPRDETRIDQILEVLIEMQIEIPSAFEVKEYLLAHSDLGSLVPPICRKLIIVFRDTKFTLKVYRDLEVDDEYLTLYIRRNDYNKTFLNSIDEAMSEFEPLLGSASGWLLVTADLGEPD